VTTPAPTVLATLRSELEALAWPERFERLAQVRRAAAEEERIAIAALRGELAHRALTELAPHWHGAPYKDAILGLPARMRGPLSRAAKDLRDRRIETVMTGGGLPLPGVEEGGPFGLGLDERAVEIPLALAAAALHRPGDVLDAGSALNLPLVRRLTGRPRARLVHFTLPGSKEPVLAGEEDRFVYAFGDLRAMPFGDRAFGRIVCVSTLEHVGMDTTRFGASVVPGEGGAAAVAELVRLLAPGGTLLVTVPYGRAADHGWFRVFDRPGLAALFAPAAACDIALRFFYYDRGWAEGGDEPPASLHQPTFGAGDVVTGVAIALVTKGSPP
jgi:SAM-dependent methyltransferase